MYWSLLVLFLCMFMDVYDGDLSFSTFKTSSYVLIIAQSEERFSAVFVMNYAWNAIGQFDVVDMTTLHVIPAFSWKAKRIQHTSRIASRTRQNSDKRSYIWCIRLLKCLKCYPSLKRERSEILRRWVRWLLLKIFQSRDLHYMATILSVYWSRVLSWNTRGK